MDRLSFLADEHVDRALIAGIRDGGYDVSVAGVDYPSGEDDEALLRQCRERGLVLVTNDRDFVRLGRSRAHGGIVIYTHQEMPVGLFVEAIQRISSAFSPVEVRNQVLWLEQWVGGLGSGPR